MRLAPASLRVWIYDVVQARKNLQPRVALVLTATVSCAIIGVRRPEFFKDWGFNRFRGVSVEHVDL